MSQKSWQLFRDGFKNFLDIYWPNLSIGIVIMLLGIPISMALTRQNIAIYAGAFGVWLFCGIIIFSLAHFISRKTEQQPMAPQHQVDGVDPRTHGPSSPSIEEAPPSPGGQGGGSSVNGSSVGARMANEKENRAIPSQPPVNEERPIDFVIVTALEEERVAVLKKLPGYRKLEPDGRDIHVYYEAEVKARRSDDTVYRIIVTSLSGMGPIEAAGKAKDLVHRWHPSHVLLVGIAGGVSGEVALGDVMVATQVADYTLGKVKAGGKREIRWEVFRVDALLFSASHNFPEGWEDLIGESRPIPGASQRRIGVIASGGDVIAYPELIADYKMAWGKLIGVEMEGGGLASALHGTVERPRFLMIRGVSDLADTDANANADIKAKWRKLAADVAAAYTIGLLRDGPIPGKSNAKSPSAPLPSAPPPSASQPSVSQIQNNWPGATGVQVGTLNIGSFQRSISAETEQKFLRELSKLPTKHITIKALLFDSEGRAFGVKLKAVFEKAHWQVSPHFYEAPGVEAINVEIGVPSSEEKAGNGQEVTAELALLMANLFKANSIQFKVVKVPDAVGYVIAIGEHRSGEEKPPVEKIGNTIINVSSTNQSGGITAGVIHNYPTPPGRELNGFQRAKLINLLKGHGKNYTIGLRRAQGSIEAQKFGDMIESALMDAGWKFRRCRFLITERELQGIGLLVADVNNPPESAIVLASAMKEIGYPLALLQFPYGEGGQKMTDDGTDAVSFDLYVGLQ